MYTVLLLSCFSMVRFSGLLSRHLHSAPWLPRQDHALLKLHAAEFPAVHFAILYTASFKTVPGSKLKKNCSNTCSKINVFFCTAWVQGLFFFIGSMH